MLNHSKVATQEASCEAETVSIKVSLVHSFFQSLTSVTLLLSREEADAVAAVFQEVVTAIVEVTPLAVAIVISHSLV
jgi:hypothetical protein